MSTFAKYSPIAGSGGGGGGGITSINADTTAAQVITSTKDQVTTASGTTTISYKAVQYVTQSGTTATVNFATAPCAWIDLANNCAVTMTNMVNGGAYVLGVAQDSSPRTLTFTNTVYWGPAGAPDITGLAHDAWITINFWVDYYNRINGSYIIGYGP